MAHGHIMLAQAALASAGFYDGKINGDFDQQSLDALNELIDSRDKAIMILVNHKDRPTDIDK